MPVFLIGLGVWLVVRRLENRKEVQVSRYILIRRLRGPAFFCLSASMHCWPRRIFSAGARAGLST